MANVVKLKRGTGSDPSASDMVLGEPVLRTDTAELFFKKDDGTVAKVSGGGAPDFKYLDIRNASNNGAASYPNADFTLVKSGTTTATSPAAANTLLVSVNGVIQKPNTGTSTPSSGFALNGSTIKFGANISSAPDFIIYQESGGIGEPSDNTVTSAKIVDGSIVNADINASAAIAMSKLSLSITNSEINASAAIAGTKISPDFGSQNIVTTGTLGSGAFTTTGGITISNSAPRLTFTDTNENPDFYIQGNATEFLIQDATNNAQRFRIQSNGVVDIDGNTNFGDGIDVVGNITVTGTVDGIDIAALNTTVGTKLANVVEDTSPQLGGNLDVNGNNITLGDSGSGSDDRLVFGAGNDMQLYHNGSHSYIYAGGTGYLITQASGFAVQNAAGSETIMSMAENGSVDLYYDDTKKFETTSAGCKISTGVLDFPDGVEARFGTGGDMKISHDGSNSKIHHGGSGGLKITTADFQVQNAAGTEWIMRGQADGAVKIYHNNVKTAQTEAGGVWNVRGPTDGNATLMLSANDGGDNGDSWRLLAEGETNTKKITLTNNPDGNWETSLTATGNAGVELYYNNTKKFETESAGISVSGEGKFAGIVYPSANNSYDLGTSTNRWRNVYTYDLHLSNEGGSNDVDGTWGSYTIQEGAEDLFLVNKRNGKRYKFNLTEVS